MCGNGGGGGGGGGASITSGDNGASCAIGVSAGIYTEVVILYSI